MSNKKPELRERLTKILALTERARDELARPLLWGEPPPWVPEELDEAILEMKRLFDLGRV
jgi:hypothetical protein